MNKYILTTGGTGGHIFPALAVAEELRRRDPDAQLLFIGSRYGPEARFAARAGLDFRGLPVRGFLGRGLNALPAAARLFAGFAMAMWLVRQFKPDAIAGFGGYASFAPVLAAHFLRVPILLHEQNAIAGASNRFLAHYAKKICVSMPDTGGLANGIFTGNPVRRDICAAAGAKKHGGNLLVLGGSQGAHALNMFMSRILPQLKSAGIAIRHQCGERDLATLKEAYAKAGYAPDCVMAFMDDMPAEYAWADLAFCRAGASTVAELCVCGVPAVFTPFPAAIHDHQTLNARALAAAGAAVIVPEGELDENRMANLIQELLGDAALLGRMSKAALSLGRPDAASRLADEIEDMKKNRQR